MISTLKKYRFPFIVNTILIVALNFQWVAQVWVVINFYVHREKIIAESCIQRNKPKNCCQGSCQLQASLKKVNTPSKEDKTVPEIHIQNFEFFAATCAFSILAPLSWSKGFAEFQNCEVLSGHHPKIAHPPTV